MRYSESLRILANTEKLLEWLAQSKLSEKELAEKLGYDAKYFRSILNQKAEMSIELLKKLSRLTMIDLKDLAITERKQSSLGGQIKLLRKTRGMSQEDLAKAIGVSKQAISAYETEARDPNPEQRAKLAEFFGLSEAGLFGAPSCSPEILEALQNPIAVQGLLLINKSDKDLRDAIRALLDILPNLTPDKRQALLALCR